MQGWNQQAFVDAVARIANEADFTGWWYVCRDHGGPWQRDGEYKAKLPIGEAMANAILSYKADIDAGFDLLHIDPTKDPFVQGLPDLQVVADRIVQLVTECEAHRTRTNACRICYEVGTEETVGGLTNPEAFNDFIVDLLQRLEAQSLPHPVFIVGQTGTLIKMQQNIGSYDAAAARTMSTIARRNGLAFKEHNCDYLPVDNLSQHPSWGITGANFGPSIAHAETAACLALAKWEDRAVVDGSGFRRCLAEAAFACGRWRKWLLPEQEELDDEAIKSDDRLFHRVVRVAGHYVIDEPAVAAARRQMYENLEKAGEVDDAHGYVLKCIKACIGKCVKPLGLVDITSRLQQIM